MSLENVRAVDAALIEAGLPSLTEVRLQFWKRIKSMMERGKVRSEKEYYALRNVVEGMQDAGRQKAWDMLGAFELAVGEKAKRKAK